MAKIKKIEARKILNGRGIPTLETTVILSDGRSGTASIPASELKSNYEAAELRGEEGIQKSIEIIKNTIFPILSDLEIGKQQEIDRKMIELDGTANKSRLGANTLLSVSIACAKAAAQSSMLPLFLYLREYIKKEGLSLKAPTPIISILEGRKEKGLSFKNFFILPPSYKDFSGSLDLASKISQNIKTNPSTNDDAFSLISEAIDETNVRRGFDVFLGLDAGADGFFNQGKYDANQTSLSSEELGKYYQDIIKKFNILYLEDPFSSDDLNSWSSFTQITSSRTLITGDNLTATNLYRLQLALDKRAVNAIVIKPLQIGTVMESLAVVEVAREAGLKIIPSVRSEETNDDFIADFAVAVSADYVKLGSLKRGEDVIKYNRVLEIETQLKTLK